MNQNESKPMTAEEFLKDESLGDFFPKDNIRCMKEYAAYRTVFHHNKEVTKHNQEIKQVMEERDKAVFALSNCKSYLESFRNDWKEGEGMLHAEITDFLNSLNAASSDTGKK